MGVSQVRFKTVYKNNENKADQLELPIYHTCFIAIFEYVNLLINREISARGKWRLCSASNLKHRSSHSAAMEIPAAPQPPPSVRVALLPCAGAETNLYPWFPVAAIASKPPNDHPPLVRIHTSQQHAVCSALIKS